MPIFKIISITTGIILTVSSIYEAQKMIGEKCNQSELLKNKNIAARVITSFAVSIVVGWVINNVIKGIYKEY